ncbi:hypothetical protein C8R45DRAFT_788301, partial [Mycena sanguinolenta]
RRLVRKVCEVAPRCATSTRELAIYSLNDANQRTCCRFHDRKRTTQQAKNVDGVTHSKYLVEGVAYEKLGKPKKGETKKSRPGFLDCGCDKESALFEFMWFKTWKVTSANPTVATAEGMGNDVMNPRHRAFFKQAYFSATKLTLDDLYSVNPAFGTPEYDARLRGVQAQRVIAEL